MKALVIDREGFTISHLVEKLLKSSYDRVLDDLSSNSSQITDKLEKFSTEELSIRYGQR
jgi:demethoxyubiquinone hydroxylase (CLK1/Coq7/Cat5 family)